MLLVVRLGTSGLVKNDCDEDVGDSKLIPVWDMSVGPAYEIRSNRSVALRLASEFSSSICRKIWSISSQSVSISIWATSCGPGFKYKSIVTGPVERPRSRGMVRIVKVVSECRKQVTDPQVRSGSAQFGGSLIAWFGLFIAVFELSILSLVKEQPNSNR